MSILNVLLCPDRLMVAVDTWAEDAQSGVASTGSKLLLIPAHQAVLAGRGSAQFFLRIYELCLQASFRSQFSLDRLSAEVGPAIDALWPSYERAAAQAGLRKADLCCELLLGGWLPVTQCMVATAYAKNEASRPVRVQPLAGGLASPGDPLRGRPDSFELADILEAGRLQASYLNEHMGRKVAGGSLLAATLQKDFAMVRNLGEL